MTDTFVISSLFVPLIVTWFRLRELLALLGRTSSAVDPARLVSSISEGRPVDTVSEKQEVGTGDQLVIWQTIFQSRGDRVTAEHIKTETLQNVFMWLALKLCLDAHAPSPNQVRYRVSLFPVMLSKILPPSTKIWYQQSCVATSRNVSSCALDCWKGYMLR